MTWKKFREERVWTLEIDLIIKANRAGVDNLFYFFAGTDKIFSKDEALELLQQTQMISPSLFPTGISSEQNIILAYSLSKMTIDDEMANYKNYFKMGKCEFYEFLTRWAELTYKEHQIPLSLKLQNLLEIVLQLVKQTFIPPGEA